MDFAFRNKDLEELYNTGKSKKIRLPRDIIDKFFFRMQQIEEARDIYDLWKDKGLNFEKLKNTNNSYSMRLKLKYRLEMQIEWENIQQTVGEFFIIEISNHYS